jgi:AcrR family transcriptional regulator
MIGDMSSTARSKRRARGTLSREQILTTALDLIDRVGLDGLTMRGLADELHCGTMTLYSHVADRDDLLAGVVGLVIDRMDLHYIPGESWQDCARRTVQSYRALAHEHFHAFELLAFADNDVDPVAPYFERLLWLFQKGGLNEEAARAFLSVADGFTSGFLLYECRSLISRRQEASSHHEHDREKAYLADLHASEAFDLGLEVVIRGIEQMFPERAGGAATAGALSQAGAGE